MELQEHPHRTAKILLLANVSEPRVLQWKDPYSKELAPESFAPMVDSVTHATVYEVPFAYAERLLRGEPNKYKLLKPGRVMMNFTAPNGGSERREVYAAVPKLDTFNAQVYENGLPVYREMNNNEKQAVVIHQRAFAEGKIDADGNRIDRPENEPVVERRVSGEDAAGFLRKQPVAKKGASLKEIQAKVKAELAKEPKKPEIVLDV